jgi:hypothetical protein
LELLMTLRNVSTTFPGPLLVIAALFGPFAGCGDADHDDPNCTGIAGCPDAASCHDDAETRDPETGTCSSPACDGGSLPPDRTDWAPCDSSCEALTEAACVQAAECRVAYAQSPQLPTSSFYGCWAVAPSGPIDEGGIGCDGLDAITCSRHSDCIATYQLTLGPGDEITGAQFVSCDGEPAPT